jgi:hypothetical protein
MGHDILLGNLGAWAAQSQIAFTVRSEFKTGGTGNLLGWQTTIRLNS